MIERADPYELLQAYPEWWELSCHLWRYEYAAAQQGLGKVADCACGVGYGTSLLSKAGFWPTGFDISEEALTIARKRYTLDFTQLDMQTADFAGFDTLVSFETLEHLADPWAVLARLAPSVRTIIASAPVIPTKHYNQYHKHDFDVKGFSDLLEWGSFRIVDQHYQSSPRQRNVYLVVKAVR